MKLIHGIANCLFALLSRATQATPKSKSACPDFIYRYDICAIYIFGVLSIEHTRRQRVLLMFFLLLLIALSVNKFGTLPNCRQIVAKNNRTNTPMLLLLLCVCVAKVSITIALDCLDNCAIFRRCCGRPQGVCHKFAKCQNNKSSKNKLSTWQQYSESLSRGEAEGKALCCCCLICMSFDY